jgi:hypothetical protein
MFAAALVQEEPGLLQIFRIARHAIQLHERELDFLMAGHIPAPVRPEDAADQIGALDGDVE